LSLDEAALQRHVLRGPRRERHIRQFAEEN
jgi:hypothetical protein